MKLMKIEMKELVNVTDSAVTTLDEVKYNRPCCQGVWDLIEACTLAENQTANIYTDSRYAYGVAHDFGPIWKSRDFLGSSGKPIKHAELIRALLQPYNSPEKWL